MRSLKAALAFIAVIGAALLAIAMAVLITSDREEDRAVILVLGPLIALAFIGTGLFAWLRRPDNRTGALMTAVGLTWCLGAFSWSDDPVIFAIGISLGALSNGVLVHLLVAFPTGKLETRLEKGVVWLAYVLAGVIPFLLAFIMETAGSDTCDGCRDNPVLIWDNPGLADAIDTVAAIAAAVAVIGMLVAIWRRWRRSGPAHRKAFTPLLYVVAIGFGALGVSQVGRAAGGEGTMAEVFQLVGLLGFLAVPFGFLIGLLRGRLSRAVAIDALIARLGSERPSVRDLLAEALEDPGLQLAYRARYQDRWVDAQGAPFALPGDERRVTEVSYEGRPVALIIHSAPPEDPELVQTVGAAAGLGLENERLQAVLRARVADLRASRARIVQATDEARRRLERDLHDGAQQRLVALSVNLTLARGAIEADPAGAAQLLDECRDELRQATEELRELARGIHPAVLTDRGLEAAVGALAARSKLPVEVEAVPEERLPAPVEAAAYFVVAEALTNVARYADATHAQVRVERVNGNVTVDVSDDGKGGANPANGSGLRGLTDRLAALDGSLQVESPAGAGTRVHAEIPCE